ncbi:MAG: glutamate-cysteine ligase family protein [Planctomycetota bacterium]|nr:glutamate-cysteine ligase family protein [Planctomycetota bacterium]
MGRHDIDISDSPEELRRFERRLIADVDALERMIEMDVFEKGITRIGLEQEFFLIDEHGRPAPRAMEVLDALGGDGSVYQTELALFNIEVALPPHELTGDCFSRLEATLRRELGTIRAAAHKHGTDVLAIGILPTLGWEHLTLDNMTPSPRYAALNRRVTAMRQGEFRIHIRGTDILHATHDNVLLEAFNTSFQLHLQVTPQDFAKTYNAMQVATSLAIAASGNSPLLLGHRLWEETRIALFRQSVDTRTDPELRRGSRPRVFFGDEWVKSSVLDLVQDDAARFRVVLPVDDGEPMPGDVLDKGGIPNLSALALHNGTIYRWNRPCYGVVDGVPHLRIENRPLPAGPTAVDSMANAAYLYGLTYGLMSEYGDVAERMAFHDCKANFYNAASTGLRAALHWLDGRNHAADELILYTMPLASKGLRDLGVDEADVNRLLDLVSDRVSSGQTGARWMIDGYNRMRTVVPQDEALQAVVLDYLDGQKSGRPVHEWDRMEMPSRDLRRSSYMRVGQIMSKDLITVREEDTVTLAEAMMRWEGIRHVPVENAKGELVGMFTLVDVVNALRKSDVDNAELAIGDIMHRDPVTVTPETSTLDAIKLMREHKLSALPVVNADKLEGILTDSDFLVVAGRLLEP